MGSRSGRVLFYLLFSCGAGIVLTSWFGSYSCSARAEMAEVARVASANNVALPAASEASASVDSVVAACRLIYQGQFDEARRLAAEAEASAKPGVQQLAGIIGRYSQIDASRRAAREAAFEKQLAELNRLRSSGALERPDRIIAAEWDEGPAEGAQVRDANEPNDLPDVLAVIARAEEFASSQQKAELLSDPFVQRALQTAVDRSTLLEAKGKWLDAYTSYFYWLGVIDPNNKGYTDYAEGLLDRAAIAVSFQDSPCESRKERYEGIEKRMLTRAMDVLSLHYVNEIDYPQMALKAIRRCDLLAEVLAVEFARKSDPSDANSMKPPEPDEVAAWSAALAGLRREVETATGKFSKEDFLAILDKVLVLNDSTVEFPQQPLIAHFTEAALATLDPYTVIEWPQQVPDFEKMMTNEFSGIGIEITKPKGLLTVGSLLPDTPAYRAGLDAGDVIEKVDGIPTKDMSLNCAVKKITGPKGTTVNLSVRRRGAEVAEEITITRDKIVVPTVRGWQRAADGNWRYLIDETERIGYVRLTSFSGETAADFEEVLKTLESQGLRALILDLRFNTGGLLDSAVDICDKFLSEGLIVRTQPKSGVIPQYEYAHRRKTHPDYPLVILINSTSASASEIVAGALGDDKHERAVLVGTRTHGKGSVQGITHYPGGGAQLKYTMAYYHLPSGQRVKSREEVEKEGRKDWGVGPDLKVDLTSDELREMILVQRDNDVLVQVRQENADKTPVTKRTVEQTLAADPQLAVGTLIARTKLIEVGAQAAN
ncbi:MAG: S41 family peptidase [Phycisphaerae bacterium]|nr:S41 family peptidase [Phycisphaerae bacterium]